MDILQKIIDFNRQLEDKVFGGRHGIKPAGCRSALPCKDDCDTRIIIIDRSVSMGDSDYPPTRLQAAIEAAVEYVRTLVKQKTQCRIGVISFGRDAKVVAALTDINNYQNIIRQIRSISVSGCTDIGQSIKLAIKLLARSSVKGCSIVLLTDGYGDCPISVPEKLKEEYKAIVDVVGIGGSPADVNERLLRKIATTDPDGTNHYRFIKDAHALRVHYRQLATGLAWKGVM